MTLEPRSRSRTRPATTDSHREVKASGTPVSEQSTTDHAPAGDLQIIALPSGLVARVSIRDGVTLNMGNFNSFRRDVGLELDIPLDTNVVLEPNGDITQHTQDILDAAYESAQQWVSDRISDAVQDSVQYFAD